MTDVVEETVVSETTETKNGPEKRIPNLLSRNPILADFCKQYLSVFDEITGYNNDVLASKDSEWTVNKVIAESRKLASPENGEPNADVKKVYDEWEALLTQVAQARKAVIDATSNVLGISLSATAERDPEIENGLKEKRKHAFEIGKNLNTIAQMTTDKKAEAAVIEFLSAQPLPAIGRDQVSNFGEASKSAPKYRVQVVVKNSDGTEVVNESGFTKAALALTKPVCGYERGKAPKADVLRGAWEEAGNTAEKTVKETVEFEDNGLTFTITKK